MFTAGHSALLAASLALFGSTIAQTAVASNEASGTGWIVTIGGTVDLEPKFEGSDTPVFRGVPSISWRRVGEAATFGAPDDSLEFPLWEFSSFEVGPVLALGAGRSRGPNNSRVGFKSLPWTLEPGAFVDYWAIDDRLRFRGEVRHGLDGDSGWIADFGSDWITRSGALTFSIGPRLALADSREISRNVGILDASAGATRRITASNQKGGITSFGGLVSLGYEWSPSFSTVLYSKVDKLIGPAYESPVSQIFSDDDQWQAGIEFEYSFRTP